uniref:Uncharacterized protein n=1 Tax=viral metagenome TaxID=1070528 RepID=A0A6C0JIN8_9ZZZZ
MSVEFLSRRDESGSYYIARVHSPGGQYIDVNPFSPLECKISHQTKGKSHGFGVGFESGKNHRVLQIGSLGETTRFLQDIKRGFRKFPEFFSQGSRDDAY